MFCKVDIDTYSRQSKERDGRDLGTKETILLLVRLYADHTCFSLGGAALIALLRYWLPLSFLIILVGIPVACLLIALVIIIVGTPLLVIVLLCKEGIYKRLCSTCCKGSYEKGKRVDAKKTGSVEEDEVERKASEGEREETNITKEDGDTRRKEEQEESEGMKNETEEDGMGEVTAKKEGQAIQIQMRWRLKDK